MDGCRIAILDPAVVMQIAAGEVIDRPASVVKELLENARDAGARHVAIELEAAGRRLIRVVDDGCGMSREEVELALRQHATSKLRTVEDLAEVRTMGFRGEGLSSIAAVSRLTLHSRNAGGEVGWRISASGSELSDVQPAARSRGTVVTVEDLFFNTPGRLKFLKSTAAEMAHVIDTASRFACAAHGVRLALSHNGRTVLELPSAATRLERARAVLGRRTRQLWSIVGQRDGVRVEACVARPEELLSSARQLFVLVNGRPVQDRPLLSAIIGGYGGVPGGRYPMGVVFVEVDAQEVDVNVHPQKREVRFRDQRVICSAVQRCIADGLAATPWQQQRDPGQLVPAPKERAYRLVTSGDDQIGPPDAGLQRRRQIRAATRRFWSAQLDAGRRASERMTITEGYEGRAAGVDVDANSSAAGDFARLRVLGQALGGTLLVCEDSMGLLLIDVDAARGQIALRQLRRALQGQAGVMSQRLLLPVRLDLSAKQGVTLERNAELVRRLGLDVERFGGDTWTVRGVPQPLSEASPEVLLGELIDALQDPRGGRRQLDRALARLALATAREGGGAHRTGELLAEMDSAGLRVATDVVRVALSSDERRAELARDSDECPVALRLERPAIERSLALAGRRAPTMAGGSSPRDDGDAGGEGA